MVENPDPEPGADPDADLIEYVLLVAPSSGRLDVLVPTVHELVRVGAIRLLDVVVLQRPAQQAAVTAREVDDLDELSALATLADHQVRLSAHDVELVAATLEPDANALLLLVEDRWAALLSTAVRQAGGRLAGGERVVSQRFRSALGSHDAHTHPVRSDASRGPRSRAVSDDLLIRSPLVPGSPDSADLVDHAAQLRAMAELVERGVITLEQYEVHRRRALGGG